MSGSLSHPEGGAPVVPSRTHVALVRAAFLYLLPFFFFFPFFRGSPFRENVKRECYKGGP